MSCSFIDLRWGNDTSSEDESDKIKKVLTRCGQIVSSTRPYFILLLGDVYGSTISDEDYKLFCKLNNLEYEPRKISITELEVKVSGLLEKKKDSGLFLVLKRNILNRTDLIKSKYYSSKDSDLLGYFRQKVLSSGVEVIEYDAKVNEDDSLTILDKDRLMNDVSKFIVNSLKKDLNIDDGQTIFEMQKSSFDHLEKEILNESILRKQCINEVLELAKKQKITIVSGKSGQGKTNFMVHLKNSLEQMGCYCNSFYCGDSFFPTTDENIIRYFVSLNNGINSSINNFYALLNALSFDKEVYILIDAINESLSLSLTKIDQRFLNNNVHLVLSTADDLANAFKLPLFSSEEVISVINKSCSKDFKEIDLTFLKNASYNKHEAFELLKNPLLLSLYISDLKNLDYEDYQFIKKVNLEYGEIFENTLDFLFKKKLLELNPDIQNELRKRIKTVNDFFVLAFINFSFNGLPLDIIKDYYYAIYDQPLNDLDFYTLQNSISGFLRKDYRGYYVIAHSSLKKLILDIVDEYGMKEKLLGTMILTISNSKSSDVETITLEATHLLNAAKRYDLLSKLASKCLVFSEDLYKKFPSQQISAREITFSKSYINSFKKVFTKDKFILFKHLIEIGDEKAILLCFREVMNGLTDFEMIKYADLFKESIPYIYDVNKRTHDLFKNDIFAILEMTSFAYLMNSQILEARAVLTKYREYLEELDCSILFEWAVEDFGLAESVRDAIIENFEIFVNEAYNRFMQNRNLISKRTYFALNEALLFVASNPLAHLSTLNTKCQMQLLDMVVNGIQQNQYEHDYFSISYNVRNSLFVLMILDSQLQKFDIKYQTICTDYIKRNLNYCDFNNFNNVENALLFDAVLKSIVFDQEFEDKFLDFLASNNEPIPVIYLTACMNYLIGKAFTPKILLIKRKLNEYFYDICLNKKISFAVVQFFYQTLLQTYFMDESISPNDNYLDRYFKKLLSNSNIDLKTASAIASDYLKYNKFLANYKYFKEKKADLLSKFE